MKRLKGAYRHLLATNEKAPITVLLEMIFEPLLAMGTHINRVLGLIIAQIGSKSSSGGFCMNQRRNLGKMSQNVPEGLFGAIKQYFAAGTLNFGDAEVRIFIFAQNQNGQILNLQQQIERRKRHLMVLFVFLIQIIYFNIVIIVLLIRL